VLVVDQLYHGTHWRLSRLYDLVSNPTPTQLIFKFWNDFWNDNFCSICGSKLHSCDGLHNCWSETERRHKAPSMLLENFTAITHNIYKSESGVGIVVCCPHYRRLGRGSCGKKLRLIRNITSPPAHRGNVLLVA
jgi:hypothetical protein